jgi:transposase
MARAYSADMRERVIARVESSASRHEAAEHYEVSASTAVIWVKCFRETGRCSARPRGGSTSPLEQHAEFLLALIEDEPDAPTARCSRRAAWRCDGLSRESTSPRYRRTAADFVMFGRLTPRCTTLYPSNHALTHVRGVGPCHRSRLPKANQCR